MKVEHWIIKNPILLDLRWINKTYTRFITFFPKVFKSNRVILNYIYLFAEYIMQNAGLDEAQAGIKIARRISITSDMQIIPP